MKHIPLVDLVVQYENIKDEINGAIQKVMLSGHFILGEEVELFEKKYAAVCGTKYVVGLDSGLSALELGMRALGIGFGDEVLTPANSFIASSSAISLTGATPVFVDCDPKTYTIDFERARTKVTAKTKAIMPVHLYGQPAEMDEVKKLAREYKLFIIEDACQAHGAAYKGKPVGSFGNFAAFSFYPGKNLGAYGDAGCLTTNNKSLYETVRMMRNYGQKAKYHHHVLALNHRLDTLQAAILLVKLKYLRRWNRQRQAVARLYIDNLKGLPVELPYIASDRIHVFHQFVVRIKKRDYLQNCLERNGVKTGLHYPIPIHLQRAYKSLGNKKGDFPVSEASAQELLSLPIYPELSGSQVKYVCQCIREALK